MNGVHRFLSRREKKDPTASSSIHSPVSRDICKVLQCEETKRRTDRDEDRKVKSLLQRLESLKVTKFKESQIEYALRSANSRGNPDRALELLLLFEDAVSGVLRKVDTQVALLGAENRQMVTCYLDTLLFAMFARLDSFEDILSSDFPDSSKKTLATVVRFWVNMLRSGKLITADITRHLQDALADCGWEEARKLAQQDVSEAFTFLTDQLELPLLALQMDVFHTGKADNDDHRIVRERLLEVAIPEPPADGSTVRLEDCLESFFNNKIEVKRLLQRRNTLQSLRPPDGEKEKVEHVEWARPDSQNSIFGERSLGQIDGKLTKDDIKVHPGRVGRLKSTTFRKEVLVPAWQFFSLIPWFTDSRPINDAQVAAHFKAARPMLGICLKRYSVSADGKANRLNTKIDIPLEMRLPYFISDEDGSRFRKFILRLVSVICHRGVSPDAGHYVCLARDDFSPSGATAKWLLFDDLARERVTHVDVHKALSDEFPYLLFYRVHPIDEYSDSMSSDEEAPPPYHEATNENTSNGLTAGAKQPSAVLNNGPPSTATLTTTDGPSVENLNPVTSSASSLHTASPAVIRPTGSLGPGPVVSEGLDARPYSIDLSNLSTSNANPPMGRVSLDSSNKRSSVAFTDSSRGGPSAPITPADEDKAGKDGYISAKETSERGRQHGVDPSTSSPSGKDKDNEREKRSSSRAWLTVRSRQRPNSQPPGETRASAATMGGLVKGLRGVVSRDRLGTSGSAAEAVATVNNATNGGGEHIKVDETITNGTTATSSSPAANTKGKDKLVSMTRRKSSKRVMRRSLSLGRTEEKVGAAEEGKHGTERECIVM